MIVRALVLFAVAATAAACASPRAKPNAAAESPTYAFAATSSADGAFSYAQLGGKDVFEWKTLTMKFDSRSQIEPSGLLFLIDIELQNHGTRPFVWDDYSPYLAIPDEAGEWNYRLLFTQSKSGAIPPGSTVRVRYYTRLAGISVPDRYVFVLQSFFGGLDAGFPFVSASRRSL